VFVAIEIFSFATKIEYKVSLNDAFWKPKVGPPIQLWQVDDLGHPKLPQGLPNLIPFCLIWGNDATKSIDKEKFVNGGLFKYVEFWKMGGLCNDETYAKKLGPYVAYWENILKLLSNPLPTQNSTLLEGFWPSCNWRFNHVQGAIPPIIDVDLEDPIIPPYYGPRVDACLGGLICHRTKVPFYSKKWSNFGNYN
jgi:hypothetical protein